MEFSIGSVPGKRVLGGSGRHRSQELQRPNIGGRLLGDVFDVFPSGMLVVSEAKRVLAWNPAAAELLDDAVGPGKTCCEIFGCRSPGGTLADGCVTELALAREARWSAIVNSGSARQMALTATPFTRSTGRTVVFEIRPASQVAANCGDQSRSRVMRIRTLGQTGLETDSGDFRGGWLDQRPGRLLKLLVAHRYVPLHADTIAEMLWPKAQTDSTNTVRHFVHTLRDKLEPARGRYAQSAFVLARNGGYVLNSDSVEVDADAFERHIQTAFAELEAKQCEAAVAQLAHAVELYRGDFLVDERFEDWAMPERERLRDLAARALRALAALTADPELAVGYLERLAEMEPLDVDVHRDLITQWFRQGRRGRAIRHYRALQSRLMRELGERVTFDLAELARIH